MEILHGYLKICQTYFIYMYLFFCCVHFFTHIHLRKLTILIYIISPRLHFLQLRNKKNSFSRSCKHYSWKSKEIDSNSLIKIIHFRLFLCHTYTLPNSCSCYNYHCKHHFLRDSYLRSLTLQSTYLPE